MSCDSWTDLCDMALSTDNELIGAAVKLNVVSIWIVDMQVRCFS